MPFFRYLCIALELCALIIGSYYFKNLKQKFLFLYFYVMLGVCTDLFNLVLIKLDTHNLWVSHIYFPLEFVLMALFYRPYLAPVIKPRWITVIISIFLLFSIINAAFIQSLTEYSRIRVLSSIILLLFSFIYFYKVFNVAKSINLRTDPLMWVNSSVLLFYSSVFFFGISVNVIMKTSEKTASFLSNINTSFIALFYLLVVIAFMMEGRKNVASARMSLE